MNGNFYELSDTLFAWRRALMPHEKTGIFLSERDVRNFNETLYACAALATSHEHEISRYRWNLQTRAERVARETVLSEVTRPGTNLVLFQPSFMQFSA